MKIIILLLKSLVSYCGCVVVNFMNRVLFNVNLIYLLIFLSKFERFSCCWFLILFIYVICKVGDGINFVLVFVGVLFDVVEEFFRMVSIIVFRL